MPLRSILLCLLLWTTAGQAAILVVKNEHGEPMARVMVMRTPLDQPAEDLSDDGCASHGVT